MRGFVSCVCWSVCVPVFVALIFGPKARHSDLQGRRVARAVLPDSAALGLVGHSALPVARRRIISTLIVIIGTLIVIIGTVIVIIGTLSTM
jgi:hypothetical protein